MKIALASPYDLTAPGGVNVHTFNLAGWLRGQGHHVTVIGPAAAASGAGPGALPEGATVIGRARKIRAGGTVAPIAISLRLGGPVRALLEREQFDVVHLQEPLMPLLPLQILRYSRALNVGTFHASEAVGRRYYRLAFPALRRWAQRLDVQTAVSEAARALVAPYLDGPCDLIPPCTDVARFAAPAPPAATLAPALDPQRRTILFVGRAEPRKGLETLIAAYGRLRATRHDTQLVIVGPAAPKGARLAAQVAAAGWDDVHFLGRVPAADLPSYYQAADVFCAPATGGESFGMVLTEAMAAGAAVVASRIDGYGNVIRDGRDGLLVPPGDAAALADAISALLDDPARRAGLCASARERAEQFGVPVVGARVLALYDQHLATRAAAARAGAPRPRGA